MHAQPVVGALPRCLATMKLAEMREQKAAEGQEAAREQQAADLAAAQQREAIDSKFELTTKGFCKSEILSAFQDAFRLHAFASTVYSVYPVMLPENLKDKPFSECLEHFANLSKGKLEKFMDKHTKHGRKVVMFWDSSPWRSEFLSALESMMESLQGRSVEEDGVVVDVPEMELQRAIGRVEGERLERERKHLASTLPHRLRSRKEEVSSTIVQQWKDAAEETLQGVNEQLSVPGKPSVVLVSCREIPGQAFFSYAGALGGFQSRGAELELTYVETELVPGEKRVTAASVLPTVGGPTAAAGGGHRSGNPFAPAGLAGSAGMDGFAPTLAYGVCDQQNLQLSPHQTPLLVQPIMDTADRRVLVVIADAKAGNTVVHLLSRAAGGALNAGNRRLALQRVLSTAQFDPGSRLLLLHSLEERRAQVYLFDASFGELRTVANVPLGDLVPGNATSAMLVPGQKVNL